MQICMCANIHVHTHTHTDTHTHTQPGWLPQHLVAWDLHTGTLLGCMPLYLKSHSYGEYVFDHSWARAFRLFSRVPYYPKLLSCVPFTPVTGPRLMAAGTPEQAARAQAALAEALCVLCEQLGSSSAHVTFPAKTEWEFLAARGFLQRTGIQYHWINDRNYSSFEEFLGGLKQSRRKNIRQERNKVARPSSLIPHPSSLIPAKTLTPKR